ncbi:MAG: D-glycero-alpha-D-manno-heptose-1,7-bisphosphate 7-phosphatase [Planctomycetota bacterium]|jgi:D-glycero-D-manno-heptose 1,7-bisphosphate phosphatase
MADKAIFLDRDDTLIEDLGYINHPDQVKLLEGVPEALSEFRNLGYKLIVVSNQSGVARGIVTEKVLAQIHDRLKQLLAEKGASLDKIYYCPYHPDGVIARYRKDSDWRKPNPGMLLAAAKEINIDLSRSWLIGNSPRDIQAGLRAGCKTILICPPSHSNQPRFDGPSPDHKAVNIREVVNIVKKHHRSVPSPTEQPQVAAPPQDQLVPETDEEPTQELPAQVTAPPQDQLVPETSEEPTQQMPAQAEPPTDEQDAAGQTAEQLLRDILDQLKSMQRADMFSEFSIMRLMAGVAQIMVLGCLVISIWLLLDPNRQDNSVFIALAFAMLLQLMSLTFYIMEGRK